MTFINYRASAGSGKTYQLVLEYLSLALKSGRKDNFKHILAITFTNKAAAEMKERILSSLKSLSKGEDKELKKNLLDKDKTLRNIEQQAGKVLKKILHNYSNFAVTTIDSFINRLVRSFTYETDIPAGFDVELNLNRMNNFITGNIFSDIGADPDTTRIILEFVFDKIRRGQSWNVETNITSMLSEINREKKETQLEMLSELTPETFLKIAGELKQKFSEFMEEVITLSKEGAKIIESSGVPHYEYSNKGNGAAAYIVKVSRLEKYQFKKFSDMADTNFRKGSWTTKTMDKDTREKIESVSEELDRVHNQMVTLKDGKFKTMITLYFVFENIYLLGLIGKIREYLNEYKSEYNVVPIYDLTKNVHRIIKEGDIPFIYYILGDSFENIMIDEFQDTSRMQWDSLFPLIENSISEEKTSLGVGDLKQSIYRWRGGETDIMDRDIHEQFRPWGGIDIQDLPNNFRSRENVVEFNNRLFKSAEKYEGPNEFLSRIYSKPVQNCKGGVGGFVSLRFITPKEKEIPERVKVIVDECVDSGFSLSDIAVLTRKKKTGREIANHLVSSGISIITPELLILHNNPVALFMIDLLKFTGDNALKPVLADILFFIQKYFKEDIWNEKLTELYFFDNEGTTLPGCVKQFKESGNLILRLPIYEATEELIRIFDLKRSLKYSSSGFLTAFLDMVKDYSTKEGGGISGFLEWWEEYGTDYSVPTPENSEGVTLMTIHKAKGLEFPVVIIPYSDWKEKPGGNLWLNPEDSEISIDSYPPPYFIKKNQSLDSTLFSEEWMEENFRAELDDLNLFYVACTRAKDALFIFAEDKELKGDKYKNLRFLRDISGSDYFEENNNGLFEKGLLKKVDSKPVERKTETIEDKELLSTRWSGKITIRQRSEKFWALTPEDDLKKTDRGILIHEILSEIREEVTPENILNRMVYSGRITKEESEEIGDRIRKMFEIEEVKEWFYGDGEFLAEQPILSKKGTFRPDRVIISGDSAIVIDFKTGMEKDSDIVQVEEYKSLIKDMGYRDVRGMIFYLSSMSIREV
ncbi:MAG: UvrD-helicase domain-containing protein [Candidatus Aminicenantes bacterium]|nr:UvrD-helicase domain-containing protein [Candidatus Aminicenantes bacterium]